MFAAIEVERSKAVHPRFDVFLEQTTRTRNLIAVANIVYSPSQRLVAPYVIAGSGVYFDNGTPLVAVVGAGLNLASAWRVPLVIEGRIASAPDAHLIMTFALRL